MARKKKKFEEVKPDMTPMIDVTFLLLIFFIVTLKFKVLEGRLDAALPKDRGTSTTEAEEVEKIDILMTVAEPGKLIPDESLKGLKIYQGRRIRIEIGTQRWYYDPSDIDDVYDPIPGLPTFLSTYDKEETPVSLDARKGINYGDVIILLDVVVREEFEKVSFAGTMENE